MTEKTLNSGNYKCRILVQVGEGLPVIFLHGSSYTSEVWRNIGVTTILKEKHVPFLALDMPYGLNTECQPKTNDVKANVEVVREAVRTTFGSSTPMVVGASLGGHVALMYAAQFPVQGLLLVSPTRVFRETLLEAYAKFAFPVRIVWGSEDTIVSGEDMRNLAAKLPQAKLITYEGAGHSAYRYQPDRFKRDLLALYAAAQ